MIDKITANKREIENELQERVLAFFQENAKPSENVSIQVQLSSSENEEKRSTIYIKVKNN